MGKRRSIGRDPLDWIGEPSGIADRGGAGGEGSGLPLAEDASGPAAASAAGGPNGSPPTVLPLAAPATAFQLERQLLLVDGFLREGKSRPRLNQLLWSILLLLTFLGMGIVLFQETRRQWSERISTLESTIQRIERERGRSERILEGVIAGKDGLIREKEGAITRIEGMQKSSSEELRLARDELRRLQEENHALVQKLLEN